MASVGPGPALLRARYGKAQSGLSLRDDEWVQRIVPSTTTPDGLAALSEMVGDGVLIRAAVAFVTSGGVNAVGRLLAGRTNVSLEVVARGADATDPAALLALRDAHGAAVSVVLGRDAQAFHPKLWLVESGGILHVLSGSGNLTGAGLRGNDEQFEIYSMPADGPAAEAQHERFDRLTVKARSIDAVEGSAIWAEWENVRKAQARHRAELRRLQKHLDAREPIADRTEDRLRLIEDLDELYRLTVEARLPREDGGAYVPSRFKQGIDRARSGADPVALVGRICRSQSRGFDVLLRADRPDLTVEVLVLDQTRSYHDMFGDETRRLSAARLIQFPSWGDAATPPEDMAGTSARVPPAELYASADVTQGDIDVGQVRILKTGAAKALFPSGRQDIDIVLRGRSLTSRWDPRVSADRERSGIIRVGVAAARELLHENDVLGIAVVDETYHLD